MHIRIQRRYEVNLFQMRFLVEHTLIQVGNRPAQRNVEVEQLCQLIRRLLRVRIPPGLERRQQLPVLVQGNVAVHHRADADRAVGIRRNAILLFHILAKVRIAGLQTIQDLLLRIGPDPVNQGILPTEAACRKNLSVLTDQNALDVG